MPTRLITAISICVWLLNGCSSLIVHSDDNVAVAAGKVAVRSVNCAITIFAFCASEWIWMEEAKAQSMVWVGNGDVHGDNYKCQQESSSISSGAPGYIHMPVGTNVMSVPMDSGSGRQINRQLYHSCMRARGYALVDGYEYDKWRLKEANKGSLCVASNTTIGTPVRTTDGKMAKITAIYGNSPSMFSPGDTHSRRCRIGDRRTDVTTLHLDRFSENYERQIGIEVGRLYFLTKTIARELANARTTNRNEERASAGWNHPKD